MMIVEGRDDRYGERLHVSYPNEISDVTNGFTLKAYRDLELTHEIGSIFIKPTSDTEAFSMVELWVSPNERHKYIGRILVEMAKDVIRNYGGHKLLAPSKPEDTETTRAIYRHLNFCPADNDTSTMEYTF